MSETKAALISLASSRTAMTCLSMAYCGSSKKLCENSLTAPKINSKIKLPARKYRLAAVVSKLRPVCCHSMAVVAEAVSLFRHLYDSQRLKRR
jgi:hypothetical protein